MFLFEGSELNGFLLKTLAIVFFQGIIVIPFVPARFHPVVTVSFVCILTISIEIILNL
jgi:hypothetical protein